MCCVLTHNFNYVYPLLFQSRPYSVRHINRIGGRIIYVLAYDMGREKRGTCANILRDVPKSAAVAFRLVISFSESL